MKQKKLAFAWIKVAVLLIIALLINVVSNFNGWIEVYYSSGFYQKLSVFFRAITGWLPFSLGDILYIIAVCWIVYKVFLLIKAFFKRTFTRDSFLLGLAKTFARILWIYIVFNIFWGLNYDRLGIAYQLQLQPVNYNEQDLKNLTAQLIDKVNAARKNLGDSNFEYDSPQEIFDKTKIAYENAEKNFSFLHYQNQSIKKSFFGTLGDYIGFLGYYNPFTGESQVNTTVPSFVIPYTTCHEVAHQLGYGSESEANFVGYLAAKSSPDKTFRYSVYFDLFNYANGKLFSFDSLAARQNYHQLDTLVKLDIKTYRNFFLSYKNSVEPLIKFFYGEYLKANNQPNGIETYDEVVSWLIAYQKKYNDL